MKVIICDRCQARTNWQEALEDAVVTFSGKGVQPVTIVWGKDLCSLCRRQVAELLKVLVTRIFGAETVT
jgi:hypothetical protein